MGSMSKWLLTIAFCGCAFLKLAAQCPDRPITGTVVNDALSIPSQNGVLSAQLSLAHSVDANGYNHYCYNYSAGNQVIEAPTLRVSPGDTLMLDVLNRIQDNNGAMRSKIKSKMKMPM